MDGRFDVVVLGAGIIGVSVALHLQQRGRRVLLVDRTSPGNGTSFGNAGLIERSSVVPYGFPRDLRMLLQYGLGLNAAVRIDWRHFHRAAPWLWQFWRESAPHRLAQAAADVLPLIECSVTEHEKFLNSAGAMKMLRRDGWLEVFRNRAAFKRNADEATQLYRLSLSFDVLDRDALAVLQPGLEGAIAGAIHWRDPATVADPAGLVTRYAALFEDRGGVIACGEARTLRQDRDSWTVGDSGNSFRATEAVLALGPWSDLICSRLGYEFPLLAKRGYHMHYAPHPDIPVRMPFLDADNGYVLAPMTQGIRLTTGVEFAHRDAPPSPVQLGMAEKIAKDLYPLGERRDAQPWMGARPCLPDMRPVIGKAPRHEGVWFAFGHHHHGLTLGPASGRLLAEMMVGETPFANPAPFAPSRFL